MSYYLEIKKNTLLGIKITVYSIAHPLHSFDFFGRNAKNHALAWRELCIEYRCFDKLNLYAYSGKSHI